MCKFNLLGELQPQLQGISLSLARNPRMAGLRIEIMRCRLYEK